MPRSGISRYLNLLNRGQKSVFCPKRKNYELDREMVGTFYEGHDELYQHAKFGGDRTTRAGCRCENIVFVCIFLFVFFTAGIKFTHRPKISIFGPQRRLVALIRVKFGITKGHVDPLGHTKFHANRFIKVGTWPQI